MARHPTRRRIDHAPEPEDAFIARVLEIAAWARGNARVLSVAAIAAVVVVAGSFFFVNQRRARSEQAEVRLTEIRQTASVNTALAITDLETFLTQFGGTSAADDARLLLASLYLETDQAQKAADIVGSLAGNARTATGTAAAFLLAAAHESLGQPAEAERVYLRIAEQARFDYERREALDHAARIRLDAGNAAGAVELYQRILDGLPEGAQRSYYEMRRAEAMVLSEAIAPPAAVASPAQSGS